MIAEKYPDEIGSERRIRTDGGRDERSGGQNSDQSQPGGGARPQGYQSRAPQQGGGYGGGSAIDNVQQPEMVHYIKMITALFAVVGVGYGLTFFLFSELGDFGSSGGSLLVAFGSIFGFFLGPVVAVFSGSYVALDAPKIDDNTLALASAIGSVVGFIVMILVLIVFLALTGDGGGSSSGSSGDGDLPGGAGGTIGLLIGIAASAAITVYLVKRLQR